MHGRSRGDRLEFELGWVTAIPAGAANSTWPDSGWFRVFDFQRDLAAIAANIRSGPGGVTVAGKGQSAGSGSTAAGARRRRGQVRPLRALSSPLGRST